MDIVKKEDFDNAPVVPVEKCEPFVITEEEMAKIIVDMENPIKSMQRFAAQMKLFLDRRIAQEMAKDGKLSDHTRRWVETYNDALDRIQKAKFGDKSVNLHLHKITHSQIASKIREAIQNG